MKIRSSHWEKAKKRFPNVSTTALLMLAEKMELTALEKLVCYPVRACIFLEDSIKNRAGQLIQHGVTA